jgi:hypothetical protein
MTSVIREGLQVGTNFRQGRAGERYTGVSKIALK